ncbi:phytanoyl-CoA dioxygenase family protein [Nocardia tenerifensis]|uniref:phytanoyl-CoA dioxygenase family protein n=1 Tax=Nocardia tenerifensis TaxID=228006 RepID=UPI0002EDA316|nr:phytanoyl-CoA dioxygenase family protein [Nocardia tenerifensis]
MNTSDTAQWSGDDQEWWDWYMTLANNPPIDADTAEPAPAKPNTRAASDREVFTALDDPYELPSAATAFYRRNGYVRLPKVIPAQVIAALAARADQLLFDAHGTARPGRFLALEQLWRRDSLMLMVALSRRIGDIAAQLMGVDAVRLYHDNLLSKEPHCGRTPWHRDRDHYPLASTAVCTSWIPLHDVPAGMGPLACLPRAAVTAELLSIPVTVQDRSYDDRVAAELRSRGVAPDARPFEVGDVSFHAADTFHTAGVNRTTAPRRVLSSTYYEDGTRVIDQPTMLSGSWPDFLPGVEPGALASSHLNPVVGTAR